MDWFLYYNGLRHKRDKYSKNGQRSMAIHLRFCFQNLQGRRLECCKIFAKYLKNTIERVNVLV